MSKLLIIDGNSLAYRCYYALRNSVTGLVVDKNGVPITVTVNFLRSLNKLISDNFPNFVAIVFDAEGETFRDKIYPKYKQNRHRDEGHEDFKIDLRNLKEILKELNFSVFVEPGFEADDTIATIVNICAGKLETIIFSSDKDLLQLVSDSKRITVQHSLGGGVVAYNEVKVFYEYGIQPKQVPDYKSLVGDRSDNIPGAKGVGKISATYLLNQYENVEEIIEDVENLKPPLQKKIEPEQKNILLFKSLTTLRKIPEFSFCLEDCHLSLLQKESSTADELGVKVPDFATGLLQYV